VSSFFLMASSPAYWKRRKGKKNCPPPRRCAPGASKGWVRSPRGARSRCGHRIGGGRTGTLNSDSGWDWGFGSSLGFPLLAFVFASFVNQKHLFLPPHPSLARSVAGPRANRAKPVLPPVPVAESGFVDQVHWTQDRAV
jgi:hypothetical protein